MLRNFKISLDQPTNHQAFYSQASWGRLGKKPHEQKKKTGTKQEQKRSGVKTKDDKKPNRKREKARQ
jgi:hypothetical protein